MARLRLAVVGVGHLGKEHARILSAMPGVELVGVADVDSDQAQEVARRTGCTPFSSYRPFLQLADAAVIAVPTTYHHAVAAEFLHCGIPVLVEKPLALNLEQANQLVDLANRHRTLLQVGHIERFNPAFEVLRQHALQPKFVECERLSSFTGRSVDIGVVLDLMIHDLDALLALVPAPVHAVEALGVSIFGGHEDAANARVTFANGCVANLTASRASPVARRSMHIWAPEGYVGLDFAKRHLNFIQPSVEVRRQGLDPRQLDPASRALLKNELFGRYLQVLDHACNQGADPLTQELRHFVRCIRTGARPRVSGEEGRDALALATLVLERIQHHHWEGRADGPTGPRQIPQPHSVLFQPASDQLAA
jgi:predicted dehydrogenase